jgi:hypothetical protein
VELDNKNLRRPIEEPPHRVLGAEQEAFQVERNLREHFLALLFHDMRLLLECAVDFAVQLPVDKRRAGGAEPQFVRKPDAPSLKRVMQQMGKLLVYNHSCKQVLRSRYTFKFASSILATTRDSHRHFKHAAKPGLVTIAGHPGVDIPKGTLNSILKQAGLKV